MSSGVVSAAANSSLTSDQQSQVMNTQIPFVENTGQTSSSVEYYADTFYGTAFVTNNSIVHSIKGENNTLVVKEEFIDENGQVITFKPIGLEKGKILVDYYLGNDPSNWNTALSTWNIISLGELYPGITVFLRANGANVEKIFLIQPEADVNSIKIKVTGADGLVIDGNGNLKLQSTSGEVQLTKPVAYQDEKDIEAYYNLKEDIYGFTTGAYDKQQTLIIDPTLQYSTFIGGITDDFGYGVAVDDNGNIYITGSTDSTNYPIKTGAFQTDKSTYNDVFISKLAPNGSGDADLLYSTYLGGTSIDYGMAITVDVNGNIYVTGYTESRYDFPTTIGAYQSTGKGLTDVFVSKLAPNGLGSADLVYSTYIGASNEDYGSGIAVDGSGIIYITGNTLSTYYPMTLGGYQTSGKGGSDAFISKINPNGGGNADLLYSTCIGGSSNDFGRGIEIDTSGNLYITGYTSSTDFPIISGAFQTTNKGGSDAFITKITPNGGSTADLLYSTYIGGSNYDYGHGIVLDDEMSVYITGYTNSTNFPTTNEAYQTTKDGYNDVFVSKLTLNKGGANDLKYSTYLGGSSNDYGHSIDLDYNDNIYITGETYSTDFPITNGAYQTTNKGSSDVFVSKLTPDGEATEDLKYSTYIGGYSLDWGCGITLDGSKIYVTGYTDESDDFPITSGAYQTTNNGWYDAFICKLSLPFHVYPGDKIQDTIDITNDGDVIYIHGDDGSPWTYTENIILDSSITILSAGDGVVTIQAANTNQPVITINSCGIGSIIQGFNITGATNAFGVYFNSTCNCLLTGNTISSNFIGLFVQNGNNNTINGNTIQSNGWLGIGVDNSTGNIINGANQIFGNFEGIYLVNSANGNTITGNNIYNNFNAGINILNGSTGNNISQNTLFNNSVIGILIRGSDTNTVSGNTIQSNVWAGITLDNADNNIINESNIISGNQEGINLTNSIGNTISGNTITGNTNIGISIIAGSNGNFITNNTAISNNGIIGIYLRDSDNNTVSGNFIQVNSWVGVCFDNATGNIINGSNNISGNLEGLYIVNNSNNNSITANNIHDNQDTGIYVESSAGNLITSNTALSNNGVVGILARNANTTTITGNTIAGNSFSGIALDNADNNNIYGANTISTSQMGIYIVNTSDGNNIHNNTLQTNTWAGIVLDNAINTTIYQNNFTNNPIQALAQNGTGNNFYQGTIGNYWSDWPSTNARSIAGNEGLYDEKPSTTPF